MALFALFPRGLWIAFGAGLVAIVAAYVTIQTLERRGAENALTDIKKANDANEDRADRASDAVERCYASGHRWVRDLGACQ